MPVLTPDPDDRYGDVARRIADERNEPLRTDLDGSTDATVLYVGDPLELTEGTLLALQRRLADRGPDDGAFGVVTGRTPTEAADLYRRRPTRGSKHGVILRKEDRDVRSPDDGVTVLNRDSATAENFSSLVESDLGSLSLMTDGQSIHTYLSDGYVCGFPTTDDVPFEGNLPRCVENGERNCPLDGELIPADELEVPHVFLNSCASMLPRNSSNGLPVHVGLGLLSNATSLIGGYRPRTGTVEETALHHALLRSGYTAAERCYLLNRNARSVGLEAFPYVTFGRPDIAYGTPDEPSYRVETVELDDGLRVEFEDVAAHVLDVEVETDVPVDESRLTARNLTHEHADWPLYYVTFATDSGVRLLVYSWGEIRADGLQFRIDFRPHRGDLERVRRSLANVESLNRLGLTDRKIRGQTENLHNYVTSTTDLVEECRHHANAHFELASRVETMHDQIDAIEDRLLSNLAERGPDFLFGDYRERVLTRRTGADARGCPNCGRPVFEKRAEDLRRTLERRVAFCPKCINVYDVPVDGDGTGFEVEGSFLDVTDDEMAFETSFANGVDAPMRVTYYPWLWSDEEEFRGEDVFDPGVVRTTLDPDESNAETFSADVSGLPPGTYSVYAYVLADLQLYLAARRLVVR